MVLVQAVVVMVQVNRRRIKLVFEMLGTLQKILDGASLKNKGGEDRQ